MAIAWHDWASLLLRWAHIVAAISWIGSSFYFMWLDSSLRARAGMPAGVKGENWTVHGGGFYHTQKYAVAPEGMPDELHWFIWESYATWLSGFALMGVIYYWGASTYLVGPGSGLAPWQGVAISLAALAGGWVLYDRLCKSALRRWPAVLFRGAVRLARHSSAGRWASSFTQRAVFLQMGAMIATLMTGNVFLVIIPNQRVVVADLKAGRTPDARYGEIAKLRSTHNNYLTLPVIFLMISNHYPMTFGHPWNWAILALVLAIGAIIRHWFNEHESGRHGRAVHWQWPVTAALVGAMIAFAAWRPGGNAAVAAGPVTAHEAVAIAHARCTACHAAAPTQEGFAEPPAGLMLETPEQLRAAADRVLAQAVLTDAMPLGNVTGMTGEERAKLGAWIRAGTPN